MKLVNCAASGHIIFGVSINDAEIADVSHNPFHISSISDLLKSDNTSIKDFSQWFSSAGRHAAQRYSLDKIKWLPPIHNPSKIIAIGQNYKDHCEEQNVLYPEYPTVFAKFPSCLIGHKEEVIYPSETNQLDYEVELAFVIGKKAKNISTNEAYDYIAGYMIFNDVTARDIQKGEKQWVRGKSFDTFGPCGPFLVTADEVHDPSNLDLWLKVNGEERQKSNTNQLVFGIPELVKRLSHTCTLFPGDIVLTGTPGGVGMYRVPQGLLQKGDVMTLGIASLGVLENKVI